MAVTRQMLFSNALTIGKQRVFYDDQTLTELRAQAHACGLKGYSKIPQ
jgi:hypothetical protein